MMTMHAADYSIESKSWMPGGLGLLAACFVMIYVAGCGTPSGGDGAPTRKPDSSDMRDAVPRAEPASKRGNPKSYVVFGKRYYTLASSVGYRERGIASWYGTKFHGRQTSSGEPYDMYAMTAAHTTLPIPSYARVKNLDNGRTAIVRVNDRGPFHDGRIIDLSYSAANKLGVVATGTARVEVEALSPHQSLAGRTPSVRVSRDPEPVRTSTATVAAGKSKLYLQVGAFSNAENAERLRERLAGSLGDRVQVHTVPNISGAYRVRVGPLRDGSDAEHVAERLLAQGITESHAVNY